jgi:hypothetical protein
MLRHLFRQLCLAALLPPHPNRARSPEHGSGATRSRIGSDDAARDGRVRKRFWIVPLSVISGLGGAVPSAGATTLLDAAARGWYIESGGVNGAAADNNYLAGDCGGASCQGVHTDARDWFEFDLSGISGAVTSAVLLLDVPSGSPPGYDSDAATSETYVLFDIALGNVGSLGTPSAAIWADLGSGTTYGSHVAASSDIGTTLSIPLNAAGLSAINAVLESHFALGGAITTLNGVQDDEYLFGFSNGSSNHTRLELTVVPEPHTALLLGAGLLGLALRWHGRAPSAHASKRS